jgi:ABC-2 type transport system permease protein
MYVRIAVHQPPAWQIALSILGLILTILAVLWFASRIYRVGILMYGKKPNVPEILRWLKYS